MPLLALIVTVLASAFGSARLAGPAESYWRGKFSRANEDVRSAEKKVEAKKRELIDAPPRMNTSELEKQLRALKERLAEQQSKVQDLEREASWRVVPREWRH